MESLRQKLISYKRVSEAQEYLEAYLLQELDSKIRMWCWEQKQQGKDIPVCFKNDGDIRGDGDFTALEVTDGYILARFEVYWSFGGHDCQSVKIPISYFTQEEENNEN